MTAFEDCFPHTMSGGEQQRAALARALAPEPALLLMDEPFSSLDQQLRNQMRDLTIKMLKRTSAAGLIVTHDAADALRMADRVAVQRAGQLVQIGTPENIYAAPVDIGVARMFGQVNALSGGELGSDALAPVGGARVRAWAANDMIGVRPTDIACAASGPAYAISARLVAQRHVGTGWLCDYELKSGALWQAVLREPAAPEGDNFFVPADRLMVFKQSEK